MAVNERERRIGENEALFRQVNERLRDVNDAFGSVTGDFEIVCECGDVDCAERITLTVDEYTDLRSDPRYFAVIRGHVAEDVEEVIRRGDRYDVIQKSPGAPARLAKVTEPAGRADTR
jgi:hypothetical protein